MRAKNVAVVALFCAGASLYAATYTVTTSGTFSATTPASSWTAPNGTWSITFAVASSPVVNSFLTGRDFDVPFTNFTYELNGAPVNVGTVDIAFYSTAFGGLLNIAFFGGSAVTTTANGFVILGLQAYTGAESAPTFTPGNYSETSNSVIVAGTGHTEPLGSVAIFAAPAPTPAPPTLLLTLAGLGLVTAFLTSRRWARA